MIKIAVCDDEKYMAEDIRKAVYNFFNSKNREVIIKVFHKGSSLLESCDKFDIYFLDIQMEGLNGIETAKKLRERKCRGYIIFITILKEAVYSSFEAEPFSYLLKPLNNYEFTKVMERLYKKLLNSQNEKLCVKKKNEITLIDFDEIVYCEIINRKIKLYLLNGEVIEYYEKMDALENKLDESFFKCHRSYLINLAYLSRFDNKTAYMKNNSEIPISRLRLNELSQAVLTYISSKDI